MQLLSNPTPILPISPFHIGCFSQCYDSKRHAERRGGEEDGKSDSSAGIDSV